ncbi:MAG: efflux transporter outer membrane subunit [Rudaea sp.]
MQRFLHLVPALLSALLIAGCAIPARPQAPHLAQVAPLAGIPAQPDAPWPVQNWWTRYNDAQLDKLETRALAGSTTLAVARARFDEALKSVDIARAAGGLNVDGSTQVQRHRLSEHGLIPSQFLGFTWYNQGDLGLQFHYDFDFWGTHGAEISAALDDARALAAERDSAASMLTAAVADTYFGWQATQVRLGLAKEMIETLSQARSIAAARVRQGVDSADTLQHAESNRAATREQHATLEGVSHMQRAALAALLGVASTELPKLTAQPLPSVGADMPADASLDLIARRADIAASRWRVEAALRNADVAHNAFYPDISLSGMLGLSSIDLGKLLTPGSTELAAGPALHLPIFENGQLHARFGVSKARLAAAVADYNSTIAEASQEVAKQVLTIEQLKARRHEHTAQLTAARQLQSSAQARARRGVTDARPVLAATVELDRQRDADAQLVAATLSADIALTRALGGGYRAQDATINATSGASAR